MQAQHTNTGLIPLCHRCSEESHTAGQIDTKYIAGLGILHNPRTEESTHGERTLRAGEQFRPLGAISAGPCIDSVVDEVTRDSNYPRAVDN